MNLVIYPYKMASASAKALARSLGCKRVYPDRAYRYKDDDVIINWGASQEPQWTYYHMLNNPFYVERAANKLTALRKMEYFEVSVPDFVNNLEDAKELLEKTGRVYCRRSLTGHSGYGIIVVENVEDLVEAPLYVEGIKGLRDEYRIHVFGNEVIDVQKKMKKVDADPNTLVRNHQNGYIYGREGVKASNEMCIQSKMAVEALGLDFGAVDLIVMRDNPEEIYVLEVNTAPGLTGTTLERYTAAIGGLI